MKILRNVSWMTIGMVIGGAATVLASVTGTSAIDLPINAGMNIVSNGVAVIVGGVALVGVMHSIHDGHYGAMTGKAVAGGMGSAIAHNAPTILPYMGGAGAATIQLIHHAARLIA